MKRKGSSVYRRRLISIILAMTVVGFLLCSCGFKRFSQELERIPGDVFKYDLLHGENAGHLADKDAMDAILAILLSKDRSATTRDPISKRVALDVGIFYADRSKATLAISIFPTKGYASAVYGSTRISGSFQVKLSEADVNDIEKLLLRILPREDLK